MAEMNTNTAELLQQMIDIKKDTRAAIERKGVSVFGGMVTYPEAIDRIDQSIINGAEIDFTRAGWLQTDSDITNQRESEFINDALGYANLMWRKYGDYTSWEINDHHRVSPFTSDANLIIAPMISNFEIDNVLSSSSTSDNALFADCESLRYVPSFDTSNTENFSGMFRMCKSLAIAPQLNTAKGVKFDLMFAECYALKIISIMDMSNAESASSMFRYCSSLETIPMLDFGKMKNAGDMLYYSPNIKNIGGFKDMKSQLILTHQELLTKESLLNVINNIYDWVTNPDNLVPSEWGYTSGFTGITSFYLSIGETNLAKLTEDEIAIAINKGWTLR